MFLYFDVLGNSLLRLSWLSFRRFVSILLMLAGTIVGVLKEDTSPLSSRIQTVPLVNWDNFGLMFSTALFSQLIQHSVVSHKELFG